MTPVHKNRNGITLLFVVSMIVLFLLMGTAFVVVSGDFLRAAKKRSRVDLHTVDGTALIERAFYDLVREPALTDSTSPLRGISLLGDMYGYGVTVNVVDATTNGSQHFITLKLDFAGSGKSILDGSVFQPDPVPSLAGQVLCVVSGPAQGLATRIVDHQVDGTNHTVIVLPQWIDDSFNIADAADLINAQVVINGRPFSGTGAGNYDPYVAQNHPALSDEALRPNQRGRSLGEIVGQTGAGYLSKGNSTKGFEPNSGGPNESYDTFDFQNMFLAGINSDGSVNTPSFHRQDLVNLTGDPRSDFRAFDKGGLGNDGVLVDNDNNGQLDGVWIDIGLPSQTGNHGAHFKPLISYTVVDLDGRINVNAHGNPYQSDPQLAEIDLLGYPISQGLHRGQGYGPPEINMVTVLGASSGAMMFGDGTRPGRYGMDAKPGEPGVRDVWSSYKLFGYPDASSTAMIPGTVDKQFGTTMDIHGRFAFGYPHDLRDVSDPDFPIGLPVANISTSSLPTEAVDSAYEMSFADGTMAGPDNRGFDVPFTPRELEGVLRRSDPDSNLLADRLYQLGQGVFSSFGGAQNSITTASFEVPTTIENLPAKLLAILGSTGDPNVGMPSSATEADIRNAVQLLLPPEVFRGLPMNINREFGDGIDNNGNGVIDEMGEVGIMFHPAGGTPLEFDEDNDGVGGGDTDEYLSRAHFARQLFIVTLLQTERVDRNGDGNINVVDWYDFNVDGTTDQQDLLDYRKVIAQWAINAVDFRDRDSIMTPFEVDLNPWNGWDVDGDVTSEETALGDERHVFWGSERPELLITETFASHDRRTQDLEIDPSLERIAPNGNDDDFDSHLVPGVSAFFELYNPWVMNDANQVRPAELYDANLNGVDLQKTSGDGSSPVWRLLVTENNEEDLDPDDDTNNTVTALGPPATYEKTTSVRRIYFTEPSFTVDFGPEVYYPDSNIDIGVVGPGAYAIVGSAGVKNGDEYTTYFGRRATPDALKELDLTRRISLNPKNGEMTIGYWNFDKAGVDKMDVETRNVVSVPIGYQSGAWVRNLGISDPLEGYDNLKDAGFDIHMTEVEDGYKFTEDNTAPDTDFAFDQPVDRKLEEKHYDRFLANDGLRPGYRTVHLQRLANPLIPFNIRSNPYLTVDSNAIDLVVFNGAELAIDPLNTPAPMRFGTFERRSATDDQGDPIPNGNGQDVSTERYRMLFKNDRLGHQVIYEDESKPINDPNEFHIFNRNLVETLGGLNRAFIDAKPGGVQQPFTSLMWNNRPYVSQLELVNVPFASSYWLTRLFDVGAAESARNVYAPPEDEQAETEARNYTAQFPYLLNFYSDRLESGGFSPSLHRVFDCLEVPSRFVGTESYVNPETFAGNRFGLSFGLAAPYDTISNYRYPGKLNINTVLDERVWNGLMTMYALDPADPVSFDDWTQSRNGSLPKANFANPYRSPTASHLVPSGVLTANEMSPVESGLFRSDGSGQPLFDYAPAPGMKQAYNNDDRAAYFKYDRRQRMGNLVTSRSSVFAIWITVGYFEVNSDGSLKKKFDGTGFEAGTESGEVERHRGFFLFDRSIPVAFEPGKNHNVDRAVLVRSIIE